MLVTTQAVVTAVSSNQPAVTTTLTHPNLILGIEAEQG